MKNKNNFDDQFQRPLDSSLIIQNLIFSQTEGKFRPKLVTGRKKACPIGWIFIPQLKLFWNNFSAVFISFLSIKQTCIKPEFFWVEKIYTDLSFVESDKKILFSESGVLVSQVYPFSAQVYSAPFFKHRKSQNLEGSQLWSHLFKH